MDISKRTTPMIIDSLEDNQVLVFASNEAGKHDIGASKKALKFGAKYGKCKGLHGNTYGIPVKDRTTKNYLLPKKIIKYVEEFLIFAKEHPEKTFLVTSLGSNPKDFKEEEVAVLFKDAVLVENIFLPINFWRVLLKEN